MVNSVTAAKSKITQKEKGQAKASADAAKLSKAKETKSKNKEQLQKDIDMPGGGGRGTAGAGRGKGPGPESDEQTRKRKTTQDKDDFDKRHEKNLAKVYVVWNQEHDLQKPTNYWKGMLKADKASLKPYTMDELMGEGDTIHNNCRIADKKKPLRTGEFHSVEFWMVLFCGAFDRNSKAYNDPSSPKLRSFATRLCKTDPKAIFDEYAWNGDTIKSRQDTIAWVAARKFLGDVWNSKVFDVAKSIEDMEVDDEDVNMRNVETKKTNNDKTTNDPTMVTPGKKVNWTTVQNNKKDKGNKETEKQNEKQKEKDVMPATSQFFLSKGIRKNNYDSNLGNTAYTRKHKLYIKTKLPKVMSKDDAEAEAEVVKAFVGIIQRLFLLDSRAVILPWNDRKHVKPITEGKSLPKSRDQMEQYVDRVFIQHNKAAYCRIKVSFDIDEDLFFGDTDWFSGKGCWYEKDFLQVKIITCAGWFVGSVAYQGGNVKDFSEAISQHPLLVSKNIQVEVRTHAIKIEQQEKLKKEDIVKALHVYGDYNKMATIREVLRRIYREGLTKGYPLGVKMRFVPNIADPRYPVTAGTKSNIKILRGKQKSFLKNILKQKSHTIQGLDFYVEEIEATLRQVVMGMRSSEAPDSALFTSVEDDGGTRATFTFHKRFEEEARHMVTVLPIMLHHLFGARVWSWFTDEAKAETSGWVYDEKLGRVVSPDEGYTEEMLKDLDWDDESIEENEEEELGRPAPAFRMEPKIILDKPASSNHYNDNGTVKTHATMFQEKNKDNKKKYDEPPSAVSTEDDTTREAPSSLTDSSKNKMEMAKQFLAAMEGDADLKAMLKKALDSAAPVDGAGADD
jgi:hypothetical protein